MLGKGCTANSRTIPPRLPFFLDSDGRNVDFGSYL